MSRLNDDIAKLSKRDIYSLVLFSLYKLRDIPEYSVLAELVYILDEDSFLKLCEYFGGMTLKIPTIDDIVGMVYSLVIHQKVDIEGENYKQVINSITPPPYKLRQIKSDYEKLSKLLQQYDFDRDGKDGLK